MNSLPIIDHPVIVRTDFSDDAIWANIKELVQNPSEPFICNLDFLDDASFSGISVSALLAILPKDYPHSFLVMADTEAMTTSDHPFLVVDLMESPGQNFRAIASEISAIENNLSIGNLGFADYVTAEDENGVFRGFSPIHEPI